MKKHVHFLKNKYVLGGLGLVVILLMFLFARGNGAKDIETAVVGRGSVVETVSVTGKVTPFQKADLGFEKGGVVSEVTVKVGDVVKAGDILASLDNTDVYASLQGARASLLAEQARLVELQKGLRPEEASVEQARLNDAQGDFNDARVTLINGLHDSYIKTEDALYNYSDTLFDFPQSVLPRINIWTRSDKVKREVNDLRYVVTENLRDWKSYLDSITVSTDPSQSLNSIKVYLENVKKLLSLMSTITSDLTTNGSALTQAEIDSHISTINAAMSKFSAAVASFSSAESNYRSTASALSLAKDEYALKVAGSSPEAIQIQQAKVAQASASVLGYQAEISKKTVTSPIDGIVSKVDVELGEFVSPGEIVFGVIGDQSYKVEINVPEVDIVKIAIGNLGDITLDAYDENTVFKGRVISIDPAETIVEGIPTYKVTLQFDSQDERVRSGMTANIDIVTQSKDDVLTVPTRAIIDNDGEKFVRVFRSGDSSDFEEVPVTIGTRGSNGMTEIVSGLSEGDSVVTLIK
jgi:HlyD family secretion protein